MTPQDPSLFGIPLDFLLFGLTLAGVAIFHQCTMRVALTGLVTIAIYKVRFTGFKTGEGVLGFISHVEHEWVILVNLLCFLIGFALLSRHFEKSRLPLALPKFLPHDWKGGFVLLVMVWALSSFLDNIAAAFARCLASALKQRPKQGPPERLAQPLTFVEPKKARWQLV